MMDQEKNIVTRKSLLQIIILLMVIILVIPSSLISAQNNDKAPDFIVTLALMAVADDRLDGVLDKSDLANLREMVNDYYENKKFEKLDEDARTALKNEKAKLLSALDRKIDLDHRNSTIAIMNYLTSVTDVYEADGSFKDSIDEDYLSYSIFYALSGEYRPDSAVVEMLNKRLDQDKDQALTTGLDGHTTTTIQGGDQIMDTVYDFSAGLSKAAYIEQLSQTKPLHFINNGARDVTVSVEYYAPPKGVAISAPGLNLTVQKENSVLASGFPQGNYTFCAHWQTDLDTDGDGVKDYDRMVTHIWLSSAHSADPDNAEEVYVNSVSTATPIGRCDGFKGEAPQTEDLMAEIFMTEDDIQVSELPQQEDSDSEGGADFWDQGEETPTGTPPEEQPPTEVPPQETKNTMTPAELVNQGQHDYTLTCENEGLTDTRDVSVNWEFSEAGVINVDSQAFYARVSPNVYQNDYPTTITFTTSGYLVSSFYTETSSEGDTTTSETSCTANFK
jgi:hypothetical protein